MSAAEAMVVAVGRPSRRDELRRIASLTWTLAVTDRQLRFYGSALGYVWTLARPGTTRLAGSRPVSPGELVTAIVVWAGRVTSER